MKAQSNEDPIMPKYGAHLESEQFDHFSETQLNQLLTLADELHGAATEHANNSKAPNSDEQPKR